MKVTAVIQQLRKSVRPGAINSSDPTLRADERHRRAILTGITSVVARAASVGVSLVTVPLTLHYLGTERFGLWMAISSVLAMAGFADFGIGNGVLNTVATASGKDDLEGIKRATSSGFFILSFLAIGLLALFFSSYGFIPWGNLFRVTTASARSEAGPATAVFVICFLLNIPLDVVQRVQLGLQEGYRSNFWQIGASILGFVGILAVIRFHLSLAVLVLAVAGSPVIAVAMNALHFFCLDRRDLFPQWKLVSGKTVHQIGRLGGLFFILQLIVAVSYSADNFIVARILGAADVTFFSIPQRIFSVIGLMVAMLTAPLWPAYGEAISRGDNSWVRRTLGRTLIGVFALTGIVSGALLLFANRLILWWVGPQIHASFLLLLGLAVWAVISSCGNTVAMFMNGASIVKFQVITGSVFGIACLLFKVFLTRNYGIAAIPWATVVTYLLFSAIPCAFYIPRAFRQMAAQGKNQPLPEALYGAVNDELHL